MNKETVPHFSHVSWFTFAYSIRFSVLLVLAITFLRLQMFLFANFWSRPLAFPRHCLTQYCFGLHPVWVAQTKVSFISTSIQENKHMHTKQEKSSEPFPGLPIQSSLTNSTREPRARASSENKRPTCL